MKIFSEKIRCISENEFKMQYLIFNSFVQGVGRANAAIHADIQAPYAVLQANIATGTAAPPVDTPATPPAPLTHVTQRTLHPE